MQKIGATKLVTSYVGNTRREYPRALSDISNSEFEINNQKRTMYEYKTEYESAPLCNVFQNRRVFELIFFSLSSLKMNYLLLIFTADILGTKWGARQTK